METASAESTVSTPRTGEKAPSFKAVTTQGEIRFPEQYAGNRVILTGHPADFTPVRTSEFMTFASLENKFGELGCKLVGLSVGGLCSLIAALRTIKGEIEYRGMIQPGDDVIVPTAGSCGVAKDRMEGREEGVTCVDWFFCTKKIDKSTVIAAITANGK